MKYAIFKGAKKEAVKGLNVACPVCGSNLTPKCGTVKVHYWAHKGKRKRFGY